MSHGWLSGSPYYFIDMELCDFNLDTYIYGPIPIDILSIYMFGHGGAESIKNPAQVSKILEDVAHGLDYIHSHDYVHRDLKPSNGISCSCSLILQYFILARGSHGK
jgi:serine/threonine protein kinase